MKDIILIGGGGHCKACIDVIEQEARFNIAGIIDLPGKIEEGILNYKQIGTDEDIPELIMKYKYCFISAGQIGRPDLRMKLFEIVKKAGGILPVIISPLAIVSKYAEISEGSIVMHHAIVGPDVHVGTNCIINNKSQIEHDCRIGDHCHISTGAILNGGVSLGPESFFGSNAVSKEGISIPPGSFIKANSLVK